MLIETDRLVIRDWMQKDLLDMYGINSDDQVNPKAGCRVIKDIEQVKKSLVLCIEKKQSFAIMLKSTQKVIGVIGMDEVILDQSLGHSKQIYIGYRFNSLYWGKGYATEAAKTFIAYLFEVVHADSVWSSHYDFNEASKKVIEKCGLTYQFSQYKDVKVLDRVNVEELFYRVGNNSVNS